MKKVKVSHLVEGVFILFISLVFFLNCKRSDETGNDTNQALSNETRAEYIGRESCKECHKKQYDLFQGSDHDQAMDTAIAETVLGDFSDVTYTHYGVTSRFYTENGKYMVNTEGPDGEMLDYQIS